MPVYSSHPGLAPLVAHDRATFGGMLISCGMATLLPALWGFGSGQAWLWWALMLAGNIAYCSAILVHWCVGYHSLKHLLPAYGGLAWLWAGGMASCWFYGRPQRRPATPVARSVYPLTPKPRWKGLTCRRRPLRLV